MHAHMQNANDMLGRGLTRLGVALSHPGAFVVAFVYMVLWAIMEPETLDFHGIVALGALFMTLFIQRAAHRDTQALHAKLDELLRVQKNARDEIAAVDDQEPEMIEKHRREENALRGVTGKLP